MLIEKSNGAVHDRFDASWFSQWLAESYAHRSDTPIPVNFESLAETRRPLLMNCLDRVYGHALLKLFGVQYYLDHHQELDVIVIVPKWLRWLVPDGVSEIWTVDLPLRNCGIWSEWFANRVFERLSGYAEVFLGIVPPHPKPDDYDIVRFTRIKPFAIEEWARRMRTPTVTFIWRDDRSWNPACPSRSMISRAVRRVVRSVKQGSANRFVPIVMLADLLCETFPNLNLAMAGVSAPGGLPDHILDMRNSHPDEEQERRWCRRYAESHIVIGVQGSNLLLPSALAGATICLVDRWGNLGQDIIVGKRTVLDSIVQHHFLPVETSAATVGEVVRQLLLCVPVLRVNYLSPWSNIGTLHEQPSIVSASRWEALHGTSQTVDD